MCDPERTEMICVDLWSVVGLLSRILVFLGCFICAYVIGRDNGRKERQ